MGDKAKLTKARIQLEELYSGIPDESVDLTFQHLANVKQNAAAITAEKKQTISAMMETIPEVDTIQQDITPMRKLPSLDFSRGLQASNMYNHGLDGGSSSLVPVASRGTPTSPLTHSGFRQAVENSMAYGDVSMASDSMYHHHQDQRGGGGRRRPGIPHSNICTICSTSIFIFKHRCLVCGRVYCRECVGIGMGEMTEGRKCIECLGRRFSQRYIQRAGEPGCFCSRYPSIVRKAELKWAEKGPRRNGERGFDRTIQMTPSRAHPPRSPMTPSRPQAPMTPSRAHYGSRSPMTPSRPISGGSNPNSFVMSGSYSPYSPAQHHLPF